jgi:hypothetical protein
MQIYLWGFTKTAMPDWPPDLEPVLTTAWPAEAWTSDIPAVVVDSGAAERFQAAVAALLPPRERLPSAILYLRHAAVVAAEVSSSFVATVDEADWETLRALLADPARFELAALAHTIPMAWLEACARPLAELQPKDLPLQPAVRHTLERNRAGWSAFLDTLAERRWLRQQLTRPQEESGPQRASPRGGHTA